MPVHGRWWGAGMGTGRCSLDADEDVTRERERYNSGKRSRRVVGGGGMAQCR